jgi:PAS domain S-box-containing protein
MRPGISESTYERFSEYSHDLDARRVSGVVDAFFAAASAGLLLTDDELRCITVNDTMAAITGEAILDHRGRPVHELLPGGLEPRLREVVRTGHAIQRMPFELHGRSFVGTFFPVYADDHGISGLGGILIDVTEHKRLENEMRAAIQMRERVLAVVSHDLRNPLGTIQLAVSTMPDAVRADPDAAKRIDIVQRATKMMESLIGDLLDIATIQAHKLALRMADEDAHSIVHEVIAIHAPLAEEKRVALVDETRLAGAHVRCDRSRISQVLSNLVGNAIKFCTAGARIWIGGFVDGDSVVLEVSDSGPGIPPADIPHLFEPYWSTQRGRQRGTGLGLFICKAIVDAHGGQLVVDSVVGHGTTFRMYLPRR